MKSVQSFQTKIRLLIASKLYDLWDAFAPVLYQRDWVYFTGKTSWVINEMGGQKLRGVNKVSPSRLKVLDLPCFNVSHIAEALHSSSLEAITTRLYQDQTR